MAMSRKEQYEQHIENFKSSSISLSHSIINLSIKRDNLLDALNQACDSIGIAQSMNTEERIQRVKKSLRFHEHSRSTRMKQSSQYSDRFIPITEIDLKSRGQSPSSFIDTVVCMIDDPSLVLLSRIKSADVAGLATFMPFDPLNLLSSAIRLLDNERKRINLREKIENENVLRNLLIHQLETASRDCLKTENTIRNKVLKLQSASIQSSGRQNASYSTDSTEDASDLESLMNDIETAIQKIYVIFTCKVHPTTDSTA